MAEVVSPLTGTTHVKQLEALRTDQLVARWKTQIHCDISAELRGIDEIRRYECEDTGLFFFSPAEAAGGEELYRQLQGFDWYYMPWKWEYEIALRDLRDCRRVLEVGCGRGDFLGRLQARPGVHAEGLELNASAAADARAAGRLVHAIDLQEFARDVTEPYDAVCAFQVLEHVPRPGEFLRQLTKLLRPGGRLVLSVPNHESVLHSSGEVLLDQPPHHMSQWTDRIFARAAEVLGLELRSVRHEPLAAYHTDLFIQCLAQRWAKDDRWSKRLRRMLKITIAPCLRWLPGARNLVHGHTLYVLLDRGIPPAKSPHR